MRLKSHRIFSPGTQIPGVCISWDTNPWNAWDWDSPGTKIFGTAKSQALGQLETQVLGDFWVPWGLQSRPMHRPVLGNKRFILNPPFRLSRTFWFLGNSDTIGDCPALLGAWVFLLSLCWPRWKFQILQSSRPEKSPEFRSKSYYNGIYISILFYKIFIIIFRKFYETNFWYGSRCVWFLQFRTLNFGQIALILFDRFQQLTHYITT